MSRLSHILSVAVAVVFCVLPVYAADTLLQGSVYYDGSSSSYTFKSGAVDKNAAAYGTFDDTLDVTGWGILKIETNPTESSAVQFYAAGFLEGALTAPRLQANSQNMETVIFPNGRPQKVLDFLSQQQQYTVQSVQNNPNDPLWVTVGYIQNQLEGLVAGYAAVHSQLGLPALEHFDFEKLNDVGDLLDLQDALMGAPDWLNLTRDELEYQIFKRSRCSAIVKATPTFDEIFASHSAWYTFSAVNRIYKHYNFQVSDKFIKAQSMSFSSYAGYLESLDDFYITSSGLVVMETTNSIFNDSLFANVKPQCLLSWQRVRAANLLTDNGQDWSNTFARENSGSYNNQWMILNTNLFTPGQPLLPNTLWIAEQIPGLVVSGDVTVQLARGYWPSYNIPYFEQIYNLSGYPDIVKQYGSGYTYELAPRATIFRRDQTNVKDLDSLKYLMRYNNYKNDPLTGGNPSNTICSRGDLGTRKNPGGCYDTKVTSASMVKTLSSEIISGPTTENDLPVFSWSAFPNSPHYGLPLSYNFSFIPAQPDWANL